MPHISLTLPEIDQAISRPVVIDMINQVKEICKISNNAEIYWPGEAGAVATPGSNIDDQQNDRFAKFENRRIVFVEVEELFDPQSVGTTATTREEYAPVFEDTHLRVKITPIYAKVNVRINFRYRTSSKMEAQRWLADMQMRIAQLRDVNLHTVTYHFGLPPMVEELLGHIYDLREAKAGYGENLGEYIAGHSTERLTVISDSVGKNKQLAVGEKQTRIQGLFEFDVLPERPEYDGEQGHWTVSFAYKFDYDRPNGVAMKYPVMVHNQLLDDKYVKFTDKAYDPSYKAKSFSKSLYAMNGFEIDSIMNARVSPDPFIRIPDYDDYVLNQVPQGTGTAILALMEVLPEDKRALFNLNELGDVCIDPDILKFIKEVEWPYICKQFLSVIHLTLYRNEFQLSTGNLLCDADLNITARDECDLRNQYRVRISLCVDLTLLPKAAIERLCQYPRALVKILGSMNELLRNNPDFNSLGDRTVLTPLEFSDLYAVMTGYSYNNGQVGRPVELYNAHFQQYPILRSIDPRVLENYRNNMILRHTLQLSSVVAMRAE